MQITDIPQSFLVSGGGVRLDCALTLQLPEYSRNYVQQLIERGAVWVDGTCVTKASWRISRTVTIELREVKRPSLNELQHSGALASPSSPGVPSILHDIPIILEHEHFAVINKPAGLLVHGVSGVAAHVAGPTVVDWLRVALPAAAQVGCSERPGIIHRLDKDTSGLMIVVKDQRAHAWFSALFKDRAIQKTYLAIVQGEPPTEGSIDYNIMRHPTKRTHMAHSYLYGKPALTRFKTVRYLRDTALIEAYPATGRTHQIRVHCAAVGHPIIGDAVYHHKSLHIARQALHAYRLEFEYDGVAYSCEAPLPDDIVSLREALSEDRELLSEVPVVLGGSSR